MRRKEEGGERGGEGVEQGGGGGERTGKGKSTYNIGICSSSDERDHAPCVPRQVEGVPALVPISLPNKPEVKGRTNGKETLDKLKWSS